MGVKGGRNGGDLSQYFKDLTLERRPNILGSERGGKEDDVPSQHTGQTILFLVENTPVVSDIAEI